MSEFLSGGPWTGPEHRFWSGGSVNGVDLPGLVRVRISRGNTWDRKIAKGAHGETQTFNGRKAADVDITIRVWTAEDWTRLETEILPLLEPQVGKETPKPLDLVHPVASSRGVKAILVDSVAGPDPNDNGIYEVQIKAFEYAPVNKSNGTGTAKGKPGQTPCQQALAEYNAEVSKATALANQFAAKAADVAWLASPEAEQAARDLQVANDRATYLSDLMRENGCTNEQPPSSEAAAGAAGGGEA